MLRVAIDDVRDETGEIAEWSCAGGRDVMGDMSSSSDDVELLIISSAWHRIGVSADEFSFSRMIDADLSFAFSGQKLNSLSEWISESW